MRLKKRLICLAMMSLPYGITSASPWPEANPDKVATPLNQSLIVEVLANDVGSGLTLTKVNANSTRGGSIQLNKDKQTVTYQPAIGFIGNDEFWYDFEDSEGRANAAKVSVNVGSSGNVKPEEWPVAEVDKISITSSDIIYLGVLENDTGSGLTIKSSNEWSLNGGKVTVSPGNKSLTYKTLIPESEWPTTDEFWYVIEDSWGRTNAAKVEIALGYGEQPEAWPSSTVDTSVTTKNTPVSINVLGNDEGIGLSLKSVNKSSVKWGSIVIDGDKAVYTPRYDFAGSDEFWYVFEDAWGRTNSAKVSVTVKSLATASTLNDTGVRTCGDYAFDTSNVHNNDLTDCTASLDSDGDPIPPGQDALSGRDVTNNDDSDGVAGFSFTKLGSTGEALPVNATEWSCVKDNTTGLIWESKKGKGLGVGAAGLHSADDRFTTNADNAANARCFGRTDSGPGDTENSCYVNRFADRVNAEGLCGITDWRMPVYLELESLVNYGDPDTAIDTTFFPNTHETDYYQSASVSAQNNISTFNLSFGTGETLINSRAIYARLVSNSAQSE